MKPLRVCLEDNATQAKTLNSALLAGIAAIQYPKIDFVLDALEMTVTKAESLLENRTEFPESSMDKLEEELSKARCHSFCTAKSDPDR